MKNSLSAAGNPNLAAPNYRFAIAEPTLQFNETPFEKTETAFWNDERTD